MATTAQNQTSPSRLPSTRESRPALIGLALLLIVGGALASAYLALVAGDRADFIQVDREIPQGAEITEDDLTTVSLPEGYDGGIPAGDLDEIVGQSTTVRLLPGTVLTVQMISDEGGVAQDATQVDVEIAPTLAGTLSPGAQLTIYVGDNGDGDEYLVAAELVDLGEVDEDGLGATSGAVPAVVQVPNECAAQVARGLRNDAVEVLAGAPNAGNQASVTVCGSGG